MKAAWALIPIALTVAVAYALPPAARVPVVAAGAVVAVALVAWLVVRPLARAAHRADARAAAVVAQAMDGILAFDGDGKVGAFNRAAERLFGMRADQVIGTDVARLLPDEAFGYYWRGLVAKASTRTTPGVLLPVRALRADGSAVPLEGTFAAYRDGSRVVVTGVLRDISERLRAEEALRRSEASFRALIESEPDAVFVHRDGAVIYANPTAVCLVGAGEATLAGTSIAKLFPDEPGATEQRLVGRETTVPVEIARVAVVYEGKPAELIVAHDLSLRKRLQEQLLLSDRLSAIGTLAAGMAHEINNPLAFVMANTRWAVDTLEDSDAVVDALKEALEGCERIRRIVADLKTFARGSSDREPRARTADVRKVLDFAATIAANPIRHRGRIVKDYQPVPPVAGDESRLGQCLLNLLLNAIAAFPDDDVERNEIRLSTRTAGGDVIVEVSDNGVGIPPENLKRIFEPFFTTRDVGAGMGLGLAICHGIVRELGGDISVASEVGKGTTFTVTLPIARGHELRAIEPPPPPGPARRLRVLVVDDEISVARGLARLLARDHDVVAVTSVPEALDRVAEERFDVVVCDVMMPVQGGIELHDRLDPELRSRVVFLSGGAFTPRTEAFLAEHPHLAKPVDEPALFRAVHEAAQRRPN